MKKSLSFQDLRSANVARAFERNPLGVHVWTATQWALGMFGECGEACNVIKKFNRIESGDPATLPSEEFALTRALAEEIADIVIYADLLAQRAGIDLGEAVTKKFNKTSAKVGCQTVLVDKPMEELTP